RPPRLITHRRNRWPVTDGSRHCLIRRLPRQVGVTQNHGQGPVHLFPLRAVEALEFAVSESCSLFHFWHHHPTDVWASESVPVHSTNSHTAGTRPDVRT